VSSLCSNRPGTILKYDTDRDPPHSYKSVTGAQYSSSVGGYVFSCTATLPDFSFTVGNSTSTGTITVPGDYINYAPVDTAGTTCYGGIQSDDSIGFAIFGDVALKAAFVVFDGANTQLGFASKAAATAATKTGSSTTTTTDTAAAATTSATKGRKKHGNNAIVEWMSQFVPSV
jgi:hypothetical protein